MSLTYGSYTRLFQLFLTSSPPPLSHPESDPSDGVRCFATSCHCDCCCRLQTHTTHIFCDVNGPLLHRPLPMSRVELESRFRNTIRLASNTRTDYYCLSKTLHFYIKRCQCIQQRLSNYAYIVK